MCLELPSIPHQVLCRKGVPRVVILLVAPDSPRLFVVHPRARTELMLLRAEMALQAARAPNLCRGEGRNLPASLPPSLPSSLDAELCQGPRYPHLGEACVEGVRKAPLTALSRSP